MNPLKKCIFLLSLFLIGFGNYVSGQSDTIYLQIDSVLGKSQSTYILKKAASDRYKTIAYFENPVNDEVYESSVSYFVNSNIPFEHYKVLAPYSEWIPLHKYQNEYYVYDPCDNYHHIQVSFTDSSYIYWSGEGAYLSKTTSFDKVDKATFRITYTGDYSNSEVIIHLIDAKRGIAVFEQTFRNAYDENPETFYTLMVAADKISSFPIIVNQCLINKRSEFEFDEIDLPALIRK